MQNILQRIRQIAKNEGIKITALERGIGASKGVLSRAIANRTDIQSKWIQVIVENYPHYSSEWLLTGKGNMLRDEEPPAQQPDPGANFIDKIAEQAEQVGALKLENKQKDELITKLTAENEQLKNEVGKLRNNVGKRVREKVQEVPHVPERLTGTHLPLRDRY
jgi:hypothetical protein